MRSTTSTLPLENTILCIRRSFESLFELRVTEENYLHNMSKTFLSYRSNSECLTYLTSTRNEESFSSFPKKLRKQLYIFLLSILKLLFPTNFMAFYATFPTNFIQKKGAFTTQIRVFSPLFQLFHNAKIVILIRNPVIYKEIFSKKYQQPNFFKNFFPILIQLIKIFTIFAVVTLAESPFVGVRWGDIYILRRN